MPSNDTEEDAEEEEMDLSKLKREKLTLAKNAPPVSIAITPLEGDAVAYMPQPGLTAGAPATGQVSVGLVVFNKGKTKLMWEKVIFRYACSAPTAASRPSSSATVMLLATSNTTPRHYPRPGRP